MIDDALALGIKHAALNVSLTSLIDLDGKPGQFSTYKSDGREFTFHRGAVESIPVKPLSDAGVRVYLDSFVHDDRRSSVEPDRAAARGEGSAERHHRFQRDRSGGPALFPSVPRIPGRTVFPTRRPLRPRGRLHHRQRGQFALAVVQHRTGPDADGRPRISRRRSHRTRGRPQITRAKPASIISLEHHWTAKGMMPIRSAPVPAADALDEINRLSKAGGDFDWHIAFHPYPENLFDPRTWRDKTALPNPDTPKITFKNLEQLTAYLRRPEMLCHGKPRRVILSEQGFHTPDGTGWPDAAGGRVLLCVGESVAAGGDRRLHSATARRSCAGRGTATGTVDAPAGNASPRL